MLMEYIQYCLYNSRTFLAILKQTLCLSAILVTTNAVSRTCWLSVNWFLRFHRLDRGRDHTIR